jgi:hypothetical protein
MIVLACGYDRREHIGWETFIASVRRRTQAPVTFERMDNWTMQQGTNEFTASRFLVPWLCKFKGRAIFCDAADQIMLADVAELDALFDPRFAVQVVKHDYLTRNPVKYIGTPMEAVNRDYPRKNWASVMLINCEHPAWARLTPGVVRDMSMMQLLQFQFIGDDALIGELPGEWNRLVDEGQPVEGAKICHFTAGLPIFEHYRNTPGADLWFAELEHVT